MLFATFIKSNSAKSPMRRRPRKHKAEMLDIEEGVNGDAEKAKSKANLVLDKTRGFMKYNQTQREVSKLEDPHQGLGRAVFAVE